MGSHPSAVHEVLLGFLGTHEEDAKRRHNPELAPKEWQELLVMVRRHRLGPVLHWQLTRGRIRGMPPPLIERFAKSFRKQTIRSLKLRTELLRLHRILREHGIDAVFLKGALLAFHAYAHPALRPMRDLDVLVSRNRAAQAFEALLGAGYVQSEQHAGDPAVAIDHSKHLPPLRSGRILIELHTRLFDPQTQTLDLTDDPAFCQRLIRLEMQGQRIAYLSPADQLLHLVVHAVFDHSLSNGPVVLMDIANLVARGEVDWPIFWQIAARGGWMRACWLLLHVADRFCGPVRFSAPAFTQMPHLPEELIVTTALLTLGSRESHLNVRLGADLLRANSVSGRAQILLNRLNPGTRGSLLKHLWRLLISRVPQYLSSCRDARVSQASADLARLNHWLAS